MNSVRLAYCFKLQSETSYNTIIQQYGSECTSIKIESSYSVLDQQFAYEGSDQIETVSHLISTIELQILKFPL